MLEATGPGGRKGPNAALVIERLLTIALAFAAMIFVANHALAPMGETDLFFHLKLGQLILREHHIPFVNLFSFTFPQHPDLDLSWGFQLAVALAYGWGGFAAIVLVKAALITLAAAVVHATCRARQAHPIAIAMALVLMMWAADQRLVERPHLVTFVG